MAYLNLSGSNNFQVEKTKESDAQYRAGFLKAFEDAFNNEVSWLVVTDDTDEEDYPENIGDLRHAAEMSLAFMGGRLKALQIICNNFPNGEAANNPDWVKAVKARVIGRASK
jgi:hypothetical protein